MYLEIEKTTDFLSARSYILISRTIGNIHFIYTNQMYVRVLLR